MSIVIWRRKSMRKESLRKNAVVLTVLVLVGAAVFINWKFSPPAHPAAGAGQRH